MRQLQRLASQPYVVEFVAGMADAHVSDGVAVGSVFATETTVVPRALGGDLGCGMSARRIAADVGGMDRKSLETTVRNLAGAIPTGDSLHANGLLLPPPAQRAGRHAPADSKVMVGIASALAFEPDLPLSLAKRRSGRGGGSARALEVAGRRRREHGDGARAASPPGPRAQSARVLAAKAGTDPDATYRLRSRTGQN
ncbi:MAG: RtcB family protein [Polyangiaceae bacterium]